MDVARALVAALLLTALTAAGCGGGDSEDDADAAGTTTAGVESTTTSVPDVAMLVESAGWTPTETPPNGGSTDAGWYTTTHEDGTAQLAAVELPDGPGPFPVVVYFHGGSGLYPEQIDWTARLVEAGYGVVVGCWRTADPEGLECPQAPDPGTAASALSELGTAVADGADLAFLGVSSGVGPAVQGTQHDVTAVVADTGITEVVPDGLSPILVLGGRLDPIVSGVETWVGELQAAGVTVESVFYDLGAHVVTIDPNVTDEATAAVVDFLDGLMGGPTGG